MSKTKFWSVELWSGGMPEIEIITQVSLLYVCVCKLSHVWLFATPWIVARLAPLSMEFSRQEYQSGLPFPTLL